LAERCGLSTRAIASLEQGSRRAPYRETVEALADALGLSLDERSLLEEAAARARGRRRREARGLPAPLTSFIERSEVVDLSGLLLDHRLLTITGTGGVGKTRIAIEVSRRIEQRYQDLWFVDLLPVPGGKQLGPYMADLFDVRADDGEILSEIVRQLRSRRTLLVLDNSEHIIAEVRTFVESLLFECPLLTVLATSREPLRQPGEVTFRLPPMDESAALGLFVARAKAADRSLAFSAERLAIIGAICNELERIPLAIELTASHIAALGFDEIRERLNGDTILAASSGLAGRHQTMVATIAWSYDLLSDVDRMLFERLSVFVANFTLAAAEAVCADASLPVAGVADGVQRLVQKSLIEAELVDTSMRYRFLESIRSFASMRLLQTGDAAKTTLRLTEWLTYKARVDGTSQSPGQLIQGGSELDVARRSSRRQPMRSSRAVSR
jgi:predicted ATPase